MDRIVVFMNGERGLAVLHALCTARHGVMHVFVPTGCTADDEIARTCHGLGVSLKAVENVNTPNFIARLTRLKPTVSIIAGYSTIFKRHLLKVPELGTINLHAGRLPDYRGGSPLNWQIINGESEAGISVIRVDEGIDTGCVLAEARIPIALGDTIADLHQRANEVFPRLVLEVVDRFRRGDLSGRMQDGLRACHWHQRNEADGRIRFDRMTAKQVHNLVRAITNPYPGAFAFLDGRKVRILETLLSDEVIRGVPGRVVWLQGRGPFVICANRAILLQDYRVESEDVDELEHGAHLD